MNGFIWVRWGKANMMLSKNKSRRDKNGRAVHISGPMAGEISPNIMFLDDCQKVVRMGAGGHEWACMGEVGCRDTGGTKNKRKRGLNGRE